MLHITLRELEVFVAVSRTGSITAAAESLGLSQSAASSAVSELERRLGTNLFDRIGRRVVLNEHGRYLLPRALDTVQRVGDLELAYTTGAPSRLKVAASLTIGNFVLPHLLAPLMQESQAHHYEVEVSNSHNVMDRLLTCTADVGLIEAPLTHANLVSELWLRDEMLIFARADHPFVNNPPDAATLAAAPWIMREPGSGVRQILETSLLPRIGHFNILLELGSGEAIREAVRLGLGISCASSRSIRREIERGEFAAIALQGAPLERRFYILWHAEKQLTAGAERLRAACHAWMAQEELAHQSAT